ncbi:MAG: L-serine ammonia-lyase, iron-sulfur-dependent subunit beta [Oscillibacter sp.]|nr:L-serine ammonia-lyase, iron-sulfur-dependent subunit beta [Oscillibacter sp.]
MDIFDILGPIMVGPSSSHTAGAVRIGNMARALLGGEPRTAHIRLYGSFAETGSGHGTDRALVAGLLGMRPDDLEIPNSFALARAKGLEFDFGEIQLRDAHPNTAVLEVDDGAGAHLKMQASSTGGGRIRVDKLDDVEVNFTGQSNTLIVHSIDISGTLAEVTRQLSRAKINIANMSLYRGRRGGRVLMVIEMDQKVPPVVRKLIDELPGVDRLTYYERGAD